MLLDYVSEEIMEDRCWINPYLDHFTVPKAPENILCVCILPGQRKCKDRIALEAFFSSLF